MGTINAGSATATVTVQVTAPKTYWGGVVGTTALYVLPSDPVTVRVSTRSGRVAITPNPLPHVALHSSKVVSAALWAAGGKQGRTMDGIPQINVTQFQRITLTAYVQTVSGAAITQATVASVRATVFRPSQEGGYPVKSFMPEVTDSVYDTTQTALDPDGYNLEVEFEMLGEAQSSGGSSYKLEVVVELTTGEHITVRGRVYVEPVLSLPINAY